MDERAKRKDLIQSLVVAAGTAAVGVALRLLAARRAGQIDAADLEGAKGVDALDKLSWILFGVAAFVLLARVIVRRGLPRAWIGYGLSAAFLGIALWTNFDPAVGAVEARAFGERPFGLPVAWAVCYAEAALLGPPLFLLGPALLVVAAETLERRGSAGKAALILALASGGGLSEAGQRARRRALLAGGWLVLVMAAWIALAAYRGI
jgi:hypothetical protein